MRFYCFIFCLLVLQSCSDDEKMRIEGGNLSVYFSHESAREKAKETALYWKKNNFLTGKKQDLQLNEFQEEFQLKMIQNEKLKDVELSIHDIKLFHQLTDSLNTQIFTEKPVTIHICSPDFKTKYIIE